MTTQIKDADGKSFDVDTLKKLYTQIAPNVDVKRSSGDVFNTKVTDSTNIGFNSKEATKFFGGAPTAAQMVVLDMARGLANAGVTDIGQLKKGEISEFHPTTDAGDGYYQTRSANVSPSGKEIDLGVAFEGKGGTRYNLDFGKDGKPKFYTTGFDTSDKKMALMAASMFAPFALGPLIGTAGAGLANTANAAAVLGGASTAAGASGLAGALAGAGLGTTAANALASGLVQGTFQGGLSSLTGGKFGKGFTSGFVGGAAPVVAGPVIQTLTQAGLSPELAKITASGGIGGLSAAAGGKNIGQGVLGSALNTGIGIGMDKAGINQLPAPVRGVVTEGIRSVISRQPFDLASAAQNAAINYGLSQVGQASGFNAKQQAAMMKFLNFATSMARRKS